MQRAIGNPSRFRILYALKHRGELSANELEEAVGLAANNLHDHLDELVGVGLVQNRKRKPPDGDGLYSYYRATALGEVILEHDVEELMRMEGEDRDAYSSE